jgi:hypothetical protein
VVVVPPAAAPRRRRAARGLSLHVETKNSHD